MSAPLVVITDSNLPPDPSVDELLVQAGLRVHHADCRTEGDVLEASQGAVALIVQWAPVTRAVFDGLDACRFVSRLGIGYDMIEVDAATVCGVAVANNPDYCIEEVTSHALALLLSLLRGVSVLDRAVRNGSWSVTTDAPQLRRPSLTTIAVVGFGRIGSRVAAQAAAMGYRVLVHDPYAEPSTIQDHGFEAVTVADALARADAITLHVPLSSETQHLIDAEALASMKPGSFLVNTCRGGLVDEAALADSLATGHVSAALDVFESEPLSADSPLRDVPNLLLSPHAAWFSPAALVDLQVSSARQVVDFLAGRPVPSILNPQYRAAQQAERSALS